MISKNSSDQQYSQTIVARLELLWGEGFMSVGGPEEVASVLQGTDLTGCSVLDIGCGIGGIDILLVRTHGAKSVTGIDVEPHLLDRARHLARKAHLEDRIEFKLSGGPTYPFPDRTFDVAFSKGAILHIQDKVVLFKEVARILKPGGILVASDWLQGHGKFQKSSVARFGAGGVSFDLTPPDFIHNSIRKAGFQLISLIDRTDDYIERASHDLTKMKHQLKHRATELLGIAEFDRWIASQEVLLESLSNRSVQPTHIRASLEQDLSERR